MNTLVYSAMFGGYDAHPYNIINMKKDNIKFLWVTDNAPPNKNGWDIWEDNQYIGTDKYKFAKTNRFYKLQPHNMGTKFGSWDSDINVYLDSNKKLFDIDMLLEYCEELWNNPNLDAIFCRHTERNTVAQEVREVCRLRRDEPKIVMDQYKGYVKEGFPDNIPLIVASVQIRKTHAPELQKMLDCWWNEVKNKSYRDQISMPYAIWKTGFNRYRTINVWKERLQMIANSHHSKVLQV